jgi:hypothetical protein
MSGVKILKSALDEAPNGDIVLRGLLDPGSLKLIQVDDYQREAVPITSKSSLVNALKQPSNKIPDVALGMRGGNISGKGDITVLGDAVYVIDGLQRISAAIHLIDTGIKLDPRVGATVYFNTNRESEADLFRILNTTRVKLSPNILLRNMKESNAAVAMLYELSTTDPDFVLFERVAWKQMMKRTELITALMLMKTTGQLHSSFGPGISSHIPEATTGLVTTMRGFTKRNMMRDNIKEFFAVVDDVWGIRDVVFREKSTHLRGGFLFALALVFARHKNFWDENRRLVVPPDIRKKLGTFPIQDPTVIQLASSGTSVKVMLTQMLADHLNSSKRTRRLVPFDALRREVKAVEQEPEPETKSKPPRVA